MLHFVPKPLLHLFNSKKLLYHNRYLKTAYLADILNHVISLRFFYKKQVVRLSSTVFRQRYGTFYNAYVDYLLDNGILVLVSKEVAKVKCRSYRLNEELANGEIVRIKTSCKFLAKKRLLRQTGTAAGKSAPSTAALSRAEQPIIPAAPPVVMSAVKQMLVEDLRHVEIDHVLATQYIEDAFRRKLIDQKSYNRNCMSIESLRWGDLYHREDRYGRFHTNFTVLRREIRNDFLTIDGQELAMRDVGSCQPRLMVKHAQQCGFDRAYPAEFTRFKRAVLDNTFYTEFAEAMGLRSRDDAKTHVYRVFFGKHQPGLKHNVVFRQLYPNLWEWMSREKHSAGNHKIFCHALQRSESTLIFDHIIREIKLAYPNLRLFTVHDAIYFKKEDESIVAPVFDKYVNSLLD